MPRSSVIPLSQSAYLSIRTAIVELAIEPGSFLLDRDVADTVGASRTPVREALARLEVEGWIESVPRKGYRVLPINYEEFPEIMGMLSGIEEAGAVAMAGEGNPFRVSVLREINSQLQLLADEGGWEMFLGLDDNFHRMAVSEAVGHHLTGSIYSLLVDQLHRARKLQHSPAAELQHHVEEHRVFILAVELGDADAAALLARGHRQRLAARLLSSTVEADRLREVGEGERTDPAEVPPGEHAGVVPSSIRARLGLIRPKVLPAEGGSAERGDPQAT